MRSLLVLLPCALCLAGGCYGASTDSDSDGGGGGGGSSGSSNSSKGGQASGGKVGRGGASGGTDAGASTTGGTGAEAGAPVAGTGFGGTSCGPYCNEVVCEGENSTFDGVIKACSDVSECMLVEHMADCCGSILIMGINTDPGAKELFDRAEMQCTAGQPICDCVPLSSALEDGTSIPVGGTDYAVACNEGRCQSIYSGSSFGCGDSQCTAQQYCTLISGGQPGSGTSASCSELGDCKSCDCLPAGVGCGCTQDVSGHITVSCAAP